MDLTAMDYIRAAIHNAIASGLDIHDIARMAEHAQTPRQFDSAVNVLGVATPDPSKHSEP